MCGKGEQAVSKLVVVERLSLSGFDGVMRVEEGLLFRGW